MASSLMHPRIQLLSPSQPRTPYPFSSPPLLRPSHRAHRSLRSAAAALTALRFNRFQAPLDELDDSPDSTDDDADNEEDAEDEEKERKEEAGQEVVDLTALLLHLNIDRRRPSPSSSSRPTFTSLALRPAPSSALVAPSPHHSAVSSALAHVQRELTDEAQAEYQRRIDALESALQAAITADSTPPSAAGTCLAAGVRVGAEDWGRSREAMGGIRRQWEEYHGAQQDAWRQKLKAAIESEERRKKEAEARQRREEEEAQRAEQKKKADEEERTAANARAAQQAEEEQRWQREEERKREEEAKKAQAASEAAKAAAAVAAAAPPPPPSPTAAQAALQSHAAQLQAVRVQSAAYQGASRLKLKVTINRTVTQISQTTQSVQTKAVALVMLLRSAKQAGGGEYAYVVETMASKLVAQGETRVRLQLSSAFSFAGVILRLSVDDPLFFSLFLATLCERCIYAVPVYLDRRHYPDLRAYMRAIGYLEVTDDRGQPAWEEEDAYFERQQGYVALLAAVLQAGATHPHLHGLPHAWQWLARVLNQEPRTATAAVLFAFLSTAGHALSRAYRGQMAKVLTYLQREMMPRMVRMGTKTPARKASVARLQLWLNKEVDEVRKTGLISEPEGRTMPESQSQSTAEVRVQAGDDRGT